MSMAATTSTVVIMKKNRRWALAITRMLSHFPHTHIHKYTNIEFFEPNKLVSQLKYGNNKNQIKNRRATTKKNVLMSYIR